MNCREIKEKYQTKQREKQEMINILTHKKIEKNNCLGDTELASGKTLKSCEIILKGVFLAECVKCSIDVWIINNYSLRWR